MSMKNILRAPLLAAALCLSTLLPHTVAFAQAASAPDASAAPAATPAAPAAPAAAQGGKIVAEAHWAKKGAVDLYLYRKRAMDGQDAAKPVLFLVHGSTFSSRGRWTARRSGASSGSPTATG